MKDHSYSPASPDDKSDSASRAEIVRSLNRRRRLSYLMGLLFFAALVIPCYRWKNRQHPEKATATSVSSTERSKASSFPKFREIAGSFQKNQTVTEVLLSQGLSMDTVQQVIDSARPVYNLAKVKASQLYWLYLTSDGKFSNFRYPVDGDRYLTVYHDAQKNCYVPVMKNYRFETRLERVSAVIDSSLFASIAKIGEREELALELADIFGSDVDFNTDIQKGDSFQVLMEKKFLNGQFAKNGAIFAASVVNQGKVYTGFRFEDENGKPAYYAADGKALKRSFLKAPLKVIRITSKFSLARMHPVLKIVRPHLGVDYAAPIGTPVQAVGDGKVIFAGASGGSGNMVAIRHSGGFETRYLHLSKVSVKCGAQVSQGAIIGKVGSSGLSTGPHLDFRIFRSGSAVNPAKLVFPPGNPIAQSQMARFAEMRDRFINELQLPKLEYAGLNEMRH
jgi:murein DD-endopeptidase MepM/ murein hydrolase activator NlpD